jgi:hypothetical protein
MDMQQDETDAELVETTQDRIEIVLQWEGDVRARVHYILDNDDVVATEESNLEDYNVIRYAYQTAAAPIHVIEGSLWFPGSTVRNLVVRASVNGDKSATVDAKKDDTKNQWSWRGAVP